MQIEIKTPELSESVQSGTLLEWRKRPGDPVRRDEVLADLETDKVVLEVTSPADGVLHEIRVEAGAEVRPGEVIAVVETDAKANSAVGAASAQSTENQAQGAGTPPASAAQTTVAAVLSPPTARDSEAVERLEAGSLAPATGQRTERRVPMSQLRQRIAERLVEAQHTAAILTTFNEIDMQPVQTLRRRYQERFQQEHGVKLGLMSFFVKAVCQALREYPVVNARVDGRDIVYHDYYDIGVAVSSERGLVVPILRDADRLTFAEIERRIADFAKRANALQLRLEELEGGTFTISNGGVFGSLLSTPILNPPQSGVLGLHRIQDRPVAMDGQVVIRPMMYVALSYDHRIIDGREAVSFLHTVKENLEDPARLLLEL